jgi:hypothetical protein
MHCSDAKQRLEQAQTSTTTNADTELMAHLQTCPPCNDYAQALRLNRLLASDPVPAMRAGFADQALARAWEIGQHQQPAKSHSRTLRWAGMAASLLLGSLLIGQWLINPPDVAQPEVIAQVQVAPSITRDVQIRLVSKEALSDATITVQWDGDVALTGYPGTQTLSWNTALAAGNNQMALPVTLKSEGTGATKGGVVTIEVRSGDASKQMRFIVEPDLSIASAYPMYLASI